MSDNINSDLLPDDEKKPEEDLIFDLTDESVSDTPESGDVLELSEETLDLESDDGIIDLTEEAPPEIKEEEDDLLELAEELSADNDHEALTLELTDEDAEENDILDLVDDAPAEEAPLELVADMPLSESDDSPALELEEEVPPSSTDNEEDLLDLVEAAPIGGEDTSLSLDSADDDGASSDTSNETLLPENLELGEALDDAIENEPAPEDSLADAAEIALDPAKDLSFAPKEPETPPIEISPDEIEAALERIIEKKLSKKIDDLLMQAIETSVSKEIDRVKRLLMDEISDH